MTSPAVPYRLRLGTRGSALARAQSRMIADELICRHRGLQVELVPYMTTGDQITDRALHDAGGKGLFTKELELALLAGEIDFAVHSLKDLPVTMPLVSQENLLIAAVPPREDPRDALVSNMKHLAALPARARVGTGSLRRRCQILSLRPDLIIAPVRGNVDTRLRKLRDGQFDAIILAVAGLRRCGLYQPDEMTAISADECLPAAGQGALAIQCRRDDAPTRRILAVLNDAETAACVTAEREIVSGLDGDCHSPIAALANISDGQMVLRTAVGAYGGVPPVLTASATGSSAHSAQLVAQVLAELLAKGAAGLLAPPGHEAE